MFGLTAQHIQFGLLTLILCSISSGNPRCPREPLFLTPYIESGDIEQGRNLARVKFTERLSIRSYSGYITVDKDYDSNHFFWYFPPINARTDAPVILWLQGGPGTTSLFGLFIENGPLMVENNRFVKRPLTWASDHHLIYIDNPVGTGFSFTKNISGYCTNQAQIGEQLYSSVSQFFQLFPELRRNNFFITGEQYGGKHVLSLAYLIHRRNPTARLKINLQGLAIGNGFIAPEYLLNISEFLYQIGLIDWNQVNIFEQTEREIKELIRLQRWADAAVRYVNYIPAKENYKSVLYNNTGFPIAYNYLRPIVQSIFDIEPMLQQNSFKRCVHAGTNTFLIDLIVANRLLDDILRSVAPLLRELLEHYRVLIYTGQLDILVPYPLTIEFLRQLNFSASKAYEVAARHKWYVNGELAGYVKQAGYLTEILVRNASEFVPADQPGFALDMITRFTRGLPYY